MLQGLFGFMSKGRPEPQPSPLEVSEIIGLPKVRHPVMPPGGWANSGRGGPGVQAETFHHSESPASPVDSHLSDVLEPDESLPRRLFLTLGEQVRILSRLAFYGQWSVLRRAIGDPNWSPIGPVGPPPKPLTHGSSRSLSLEEIKARLAASGEDGTP